MEKPAPSWRGTFGRMRPAEAEETAQTTSRLARDVATRVRASMPTWLIDALIRLGVTLFTIAIFAAATTLGVLVAINLGDGNPWVAVLTTIGLLLFVVLPLRLLWVMWQARER